MASFLPQLLALILTTRERRQRGRLKENAAHLAPRRGDATSANSADWELEPEDASV